MDNVVIPDHLQRACSKSNDRAAWLKRLPRTIRDLRNQWSLTLGDPIETDASCSWVGPCVRANGSPAVLKIGMPHMEAQSEIDGLLFWNGDPMVLIIEVDRETNAMLLEQCIPGTPAREIPEDEQDIVVANMLKRLWRKPPSPHPFQPLTAMIAEWTKESLRQLEEWPDPALAKEGVQILEELANEPAGEVLLATDIHAGNILRAEREPWLAIDPKPFVGDPTYDATQHLINCPDRIREDPTGTISRFAGLLGIDHRRVRLWTFARLAAESGRNMETAQALARKVKGS